MPAAAPDARDKLDVVFYRDAKMDDGRHNNNGWLQELPDPITKLTWDNAVLLSPATAKELGVFTERQPAKPEVLQLHGRGHREWSQPCAGRFGFSPAWLMTPIGLALGYGREKTGRVGTGAGFNAYALRRSDGFITLPARTVRDTGDKSYELANTQSHWNMEGRPVVREANLDSTARIPKFAKTMRPEEPRPDWSCRRFIRIRWIRPRPTRLHQWGMSIDLNRCVGCSACMIACQSENNIPDRRQGNGGQEPRDALDSASIVITPGRTKRRMRPAGGRAADALPALRSGPLRKRLPGQRHLARRRGFERDDLQPVRRHPLLFQQLPV